MRVLVSALYAVCVPAAVLAQSHAVPAISGEINEAKALKFLYGNYDSASHGSTSRVAGQDWYVGPYAKQSGVIDGKEVWFLYTTANWKGNDCHACQVTLGAAVFEKQGTQWVKRVDERNVSTIGSYGVPLDAKAVQWGNQSYGLLVENGWTGYGQISGGQTLFGFENGKFCDVFSIATMDTNAGSLAADKDKYSWEAKWKFGAAGPTGAFDLVVTLDPRNRYQRGPEGRKRVPLVGVYRYDGKVYRHVVRKVPL
jgi:hypothetical protein